MRRACLVISALLFLFLGCVAVADSKIIGHEVHKASPGGVVPWNPFPSTEPLDIARDVLRHVTYVSESPANVWQHPKATYLCKTGDCEDFALLMVVAMMAEGHDAYVVRGIFPLMNAEGKVTYSGHAWVGIRIDGVEYFIDSTNKMVSLDMPDSVPWSSYTIRARIKYIDGMGYVK